ncbi:hypothetical protein [Halomicrobium salinisoli]|uniref:hypothetical protein n=1 Tax=Halomicrobium salinisoli TaxID=2878391 RepID=UPI001CF038BA|nr:hypothetical protein [Halomicrobium salinisoli]
MKRRTYLSGAVAVLASFAGCTDDGSSAATSTDQSPTQSQSGLIVKDVQVIEYKPKDYEDRPEVAGTLEATVEYAGTGSITVESFRITGDVPRPHDATRTGRFTNPSGDSIDSIDIESSESQQIQMVHEPLYYVDLSSENGRTQEELDTSTCTGETRTATLHFETENQGTIERQIELEFGGESVEFDEFAPDFGCTNVTVVSVSP